MQAFEAALRRKDADARFFFAPKSLRAGGFWLPELAQEIAEATAFILLVGEKGIGPWQAMEYYEALDRRVKQLDFPVVLLLLEGQPAPGLPFLRQLHWVITPDATSEKSSTLVIEAAAGGGAPPGELWRHTAPYRGLSAMTESDADYFFGRNGETAEVIGALAATPDKLPIVLGNSGVGKSSIAQAGVLAALMRQAWPETVEAAGRWPQAFSESRHWCFLRLKPGTEPVRALIEPFLWTWQFDAVDPKRAELLSSWVSRLIDGKVTLRDLLDATEARYHDELHQPKPPAFLLYIDQGEELYIRAEERQRHRFSEIVASGLGDPRLRAVMSMRADFFGDLMKDEAIYTVHRLIKVPPLREAQLREVVSRPAQLLSARFETEGLADIITRRTAEDAVKDVGALPLLSYTLDDMWKHMIERGDGVLRLPAQSFELGNVLVDRADTFLASHPNAEDQLRRIFTLKLATVREGEEPTRRRALSWVAEHPTGADYEAGVQYLERIQETMVGRPNVSSSSARPPTGPGATPEPAPTKAVDVEELFQEIGNELEIDPTTLGAEPDVGANVARAHSEGLIGPEGEPRIADLSVQTHSSASEVRQAYGVSGYDVQSAHVGPTSFLRDVPEYSRGGAETLLLETPTHRAFDAYWKDWAMEQRRLGRTTCTVEELHTVMLDAIEQIPGLAQRTKNALAWRMEQELIALELRPGDALDLPYRNIPARPTAGVAGGAGAPASSRLGDAQPPTSESAAAEPSGPTPSEQPPPAVSSAEGASLDPNVSSTSAAPPPPTSGARVDYRTLDADRLAELAREGDTDAAAEIFSRAPGESGAATPIGTEELLPRRGVFGVHRSRAAAVPEREDAAA